MKVWLLRSSELLPISNSNQRLLRVGLIGKHLSENNHDVTWFSSTFDHFRKKQVSDSDVVLELKPNYRLNLIYALGYKKNISIARILNHKISSVKLRKKMKKLEKPDLIYSSFPTIEFAYEAIKYGKKNNVPVIIDIRDLWPDIFEHNLKGLLKICSKPYVKYLEHKTKYIMKNCYSLMAISDPMLEWGLKKGNRIKSNLDKSFFIGYEKNDSIAKQKKVKIDKKRFNICFFATINNQFNYDIIVKLAEKLKNDNVDILICGVGPKLAEFKKKCSGLENIKFLGWLDQFELNYVLKNSKLGLLPYKNTFDFQMSVSNKFGEYISYGLPILITSSGYMENFVKKYNIGLCSTDLDEMRNFILNLMNNDKKYKEMSANSSALFDSKFDADKIYEKLVKYFEKIEKEYTK